MLRNVAKWLLQRPVNWLYVKVIGQPPVVVQTETVEQQAERQGISIAAATLQRAGEKNQTHRRIGPPKLMPGVLPENLTFKDDPGTLGPYLALDSEFNAPIFNWANQLNCGLGFPGYAYLAELSQRSEYRAPSETMASEMTREWIKLVVKGKKRKKDKKESVADDAALSEAAPSSTQQQLPAKPDTNIPEVDEEMEAKLEEIEEALEQFKVRDIFRKIAELDGLFGRGQLFIDQDPGTRDPDEIRQLPLVVDKATIKKGSIRGFKVIEPIWTTPFTYNATDPTAPDFYVPRAWFVLGKRTHASRLLTFVSREVPDILKPSYNFGGLSMTQLMEPYVFQWLRTRNSVSDLIHNFSVMILNTDMSKVLGGDAAAGQSLIDRAKLFIANRDNQGLALTDKDTEELTMLNVPLGSLDKLQAQSQEHMAAPSHIPLVKLLGVTPTGLNANSEGEIQVFYDFVRACQQFFFGPHLDTILQIIQLHLYGQVDDSIGFEFVSLASPSVKELALIRKADGETAQTYVNMGAISPDEVRNKLTSDPESGYDNLQGEAPPPPNMLEMQGALEGASAEEAVSS